MTETLLGILKEPYRIINNRINNEKNIFDNIMYSFTPICLM